MPGRGANSADAVRWGSVRQFAAQAALLRQCHCSYTRRSDQNAAHPGTRGYGIASRMFPNPHM